MRACPLNQMLGPSGQVEVILELSHRPAHGREMQRSQWLGGVDDYVLLVHLVDFATGEAERSLGRAKQDFTLAFSRIENVTINHDVGLLAKR